MAKDHLNIKITGRVQGVFFRHSAWLKAQQLEITGFVRNDINGSVYIEAEGEKEDLDEFVKWCHHGPPFARVDQTKTSPGSLQHFPGFEILG
jgi:acylphosphatase